MPSTPPRTPRYNGDHFATPTTPRYGPRFEPDAWDARRRRTATTTSSVTSNSSPGTTPRRRYHGGFTDDKYTLSDAYTDTSPDTTPLSPTSRDRTRTRTISGAQPGAPMLTPRETPGRRRTVKGVVDENRAVEEEETDHDFEDDEEDDEDEGAEDGDYDALLAATMSTPRKGISRVLFPTSERHTTTPGFTVYDDTSTREKLAIFRDAARRAQSIDSTQIATPKKRSREDDLSHMKNLDATPAEEARGMTFVFRGKKIFRPFAPADNDGDEDDGNDIAIAPIKPRVLFPHAKQTSIPLEQSPRTTPAATHADDIPDKVFD
ncbi:uncharacterized protein V1518DRAFT_458092 [Limtongia smithiae]|uniref:uncharacterized protein n=1 Tax=Limtongia smithiae TaxID=1125753 RepID=UPI0034CF893B